MTEQQRKFYEQVTIPDISIENVISGKTSIDHIREYEEKLREQLNTTNNDTNRTISN